MKNKSFNLVLGTAQLDQNYSLSKRALDPLHIITLKFLDFFLFFFFLKLKTCDPIIICNFF